ncbi:hypothetical protein [uncultured Fibrobacter sp.]|uniref:hypothetical protein n=1 Tax=uncultured Fibrobacter sp. TaxID=261512 RepID=UPI00262EDA18|nr:hypothetical protein [uncultured Fibrobacter sp.]
MKKGLFVLFILACMAWSSESIRVEVKDEQPTNVQMLGLRLRIINNSGQQYNGIQVKYYLKKQATDNLVIEPYYMGNLSVQLEEFDNTTAVLKVNVPVLGTGSTPDATGISVGIRRSGWGSIHKENMSGCPGADFAEAASYGVYSGDNLIAGNLPSEGALKLRFIGLRPETADSASPWVQLQNYGDSAVSLNGVKIKDASGNLHSLDSLTLAAKATLRVCNGSVSNCVQDSVVKSISGLSFGKVGEFVLYRNSVPIDYVAWGARGNYADSLEIENKVIDPNRFFKTSEDPVFGPVSIYRKGDFFRTVIKDGTDSIVSWNKFRKNMARMPLTQLPYADPSMLAYGAEVFKRNGEETMLAWVPVAGAKSYEVVVLNANDQSEVLHEVTDKTHYSVLLAEGEYLWIVIPQMFGVAEYGQGHTYENLNISYDDYKSFKVFALSDSHHTAHDLNVEPLAARKDSYLLDLKWGERSIEAEWDKPHNTTGYVDQFGNRRFTDPKHYDFDAEESWRCWAVATAELNHYYEGTLTQDEIIFHLKGTGAFSDPILDAFPHGSEGSGDPWDVLSWALESPNVFVYDWRFFLNDDIMTAALENRYPVILWEGNHIMLVDADMVIDGAAYGVEGNIHIYRFHNIDNNGTIVWKPIYLSNLNRAFVVAKPIGEKARMSEVYDDADGNHVMSFNEIYDADGDTLLDFDEYYRFETYQFDSNYDMDNDGKFDYEEYRQFATAKRDLNADYDKDGIKDKTEIMSYTIREPYPESETGLLDGEYGVKTEFYTDIDGDGLRAEKDIDSDGDGKNDGDEDVNANGIKDDGETDVYIKDNNQGVSSITLYALSELNYNDGVECYNDKTETQYCNVAAAAVALNGEYSAKVGARSTVGDIYSKGKVILRSNTRVKGNVVLAEPSNIDDIYLQNGTTIDGEITSLPLTQWEDKYLPRNYDLEDFSVPSNHELIVRNNETAVLNPGSYSFVKVEAGGTLIIPSGTIYIGSIQLDPRSCVMFTMPGQETTIHVKGNFSWRATTLNGSAEYASIAKGFKLVLHASGKRLYIDNVMAGNIVAPYSEVVIAQSKKLFYGMIFADKISVHQYAKIYHVDFDPIQNSLVVSMGGI